MKKATALMLVLALAAACSHKSRRSSGPLPVPASDAILVRNLAPGSTVLLLRTPEAVHDVHAVVRLWSENDAVIAESLVKLGEDDAGFVAARLRELSMVGVESVAALARKLGERARPHDEGVEIAQRTVADVGGNGRFSRVIPGVVQILATRPGSPDFVVTGLRPDGKTGIIVDASAAPRADETKPAAREATEPGTILCVKSPGGRIRVVSGDKVVSDVASEPGALVRVVVPPGGGRVEFVDAKTGAVTHSVEIGAEARRPAPGPMPTPAPAPADSARVGEIALVHRVYGAFLRLSPGVKLSPGEDIVVYRDGKEIARGKILHLCSSDRAYPDGAAQLTCGAPDVRKGDEARRPK